MIYLLSGVINLAMAALVAFHPLAIPVCVVIKLMSVPVIYYLNRDMSKGLGIYFYLNLGISRSEYYMIPIAVDLMLFFVLVSIAGVVGYVIG